MGEGLTATERPGIDVCALLCKAVRRCPRCRSTYAKPEHSTPSLFVCTDPNMASGEYVGLRGCGFLGIGLLRGVARCSQEPGARHPGLTVCHVSVTSGMDRQGC